MYTGDIRENDANRIAAAQLVQQFLTSKAFKYSKNPPSTGGKDVVDNFLSNSRQGFLCAFCIGWHDDTQTDGRSMPLCKRILCKGGQLQIR
jgi:hypothetical protein